MPRTSAKAMARMVGIDIEVFRAALREKNFDWHAPETAWVVEADSPEHLQMIAVLKTIFAAEVAASAPKPKKAAAKPRAKKAAPTTAKKAAPKTAKKKSA